MGTTSARQKIRLLIVDGHTVIREGLSLILSAESDLEVIGSASNGQDAVEIVTAQKPDVVIMDLNMPVMNGVDAIKQIRGNRPEAELIVLSSHQNRREVREASDSGAHAYLLKDRPTEDLARAVRNAYAGRSSLNPEIAAAVLAHLSEKPRHRHDNAEMTSMEVRALEMLRDGSSIAQIATAMAISVNTVKSRLSRIYEKLLVKGRTQAVAEALRRKLITHGSTGS